MSRAMILLIVIVLIIVGGLVLLSRHSASVAPHHVEKVVTLNAAANAAP